MYDKWNILPWYDVHLMLSTPEELQELTLTLTLTVLSMYQCTSVLMWVTCKTKSSNI